MGWAKFDDQFSDHPKVLAAGPMAELLAMRAVIYCARYETDGLIQAEQLPRLALGITAPRKHVAALVRVGLWDETDGGWMVHDFLDYHPSAKKRDKEREGARERMAKVRGKKERTSENVQANGDRSSGYPVPDPVPPLSNPPETQGGDHLGLVGVDLIDQAISEARNRALRQAQDGPGEKIHSPLKWLAWHADTQEQDWHDNATGLLARYPELTLNQLADCLLGRTSILRSMRPAS